jgi:HSP20 family molecular chaperone IbpA
MLMPSIFRTNVFDDFFEDPFKDFGRRAVGRPVNDLMKTDIKENEDGYEVSIAMPGVKKEDIQAELKEGYLTVTATTKQDKDEKDDKGRYIRRERFYGTAKRSFYVGEDVKQEDIKAKYTDGVLILDVPKVQPKVEEEEAPKYIDILG